MKTPREYLIEPIGERYNNTKKIEDKELILNSNIRVEDHMYVNRIGKVVGTPVKEGVLKEGDKVIVHHNTFRKWYNVRGLLKDSSNYIKDGVFYAGMDQIYAYDRGEGWVTTEDNCFIKPIKKENNNGLETNLKPYEERVGIVKIGNPILEAQGVKVGDKIFYTGPAEHKFKIDGELLYRMSASVSVSLVL